MSIKKGLLVAASGILVGGLSWYVSDHIKRSPASSSLPQVPHPSQIGAAPLQFGKMNQAMTVLISPVNGVPDHDNQEITLRAEVTLHRTISGEVEFQWELPEGAQIVSGLESDSWAHLQAGQTATAEISLLNVSKEGGIKTVNFHVKAMDDEVKYAVSGSFGTNNYIIKDSATATGILKVGTDKELGLQNSNEPAKILRLQQ